MTTSPGQEISAAISPAALKHLEALIQKDSRLVPPHPTYPDKSLKPR